MKILLVRPPRIKQSITLSDFMFSEPIGLEMIYGVLEKNHDVEIFDMMIENISLSKKTIEYKPDVVGITSLCIDVNKVIELCSEVKSTYNNIITIVGGTQAFLNPNSFFHESVDHIFEYSNLKNLSEFFSLISSGKIQMVNGIRTREFNYESTGVRGYNQYLLPNRKSTLKYRHEYSYFGYRPAAIMEFGTGCEKVCNFCLRWRIEGAKEKLIDLELTKKDMASIDESTIMFMDNDFFANEEKIKLFINIVKELNLNKNYIMYASVKGIIEFEKHLEELKSLGLKALLVGYETFNEEEMSKYHKKSTTDDNLKAANILKNLKIDVWASFIAHPDWSKKDFKLFRKYIKKLKPQITSISPLTPFPNLPMYREYEHRLLYKADDYEKWSFGQVIIKPSQIRLNQYYYELLKTNLYVNLFINKNTDMIKKYGIKNIIKILIGSINAAKKYIILMIKN